MSSIDKYVEGEARRCNPAVSVVKRDGMIYGSINGQRIFAIADRYGYLTDSERNTIQNSVRRYQHNQEEERERLRRERERLEKERRDLRDKVRAQQNTLRSKLRQSYSDAQRTIDSTKKSLSFDRALKTMSDYNVAHFENRAKTVEEKVANCSVALSNSFAAVNGQIDSIVITDRDTTENYRLKSNRLSQIKTGLFADLPHREIEKLNSELGNLKKALNAVNDIIRQLRDISQQGLVGQIVQDAIREAKGYPIKAVEDVDKMVASLQKHITEIGQIKQDSETQQQHIEISKLNGLLQACIQIRKYTVEQNYEKASFRGQILETATKVLAAYSELETAEYTTCSSEKMSSVFSAVQEVLDSSVDDEQTLKMLNNLFDEYIVCKRDDELQADNYRDYLVLTDKLRQFGVGENEIEKFDSKDYTTQRKSILKQLLNKEIEAAVSCSRSSLIMACKVMDDMGYQMLKCDFGGSDEDENQVTANESALACEAIYVIPGCDGVVMEVIASDCGLTRRILPVRRTNGMTTSPKRVNEVGKRLEQSGEIVRFFQGYSNVGGGNMTLKNAVDSETPHSEETIEKNGVLELNEDMEKEFDKLVANATAEQKAAWKSKISAEESFTVGSKAADCSKNRTIIAAQTANNIKAAVMKH